jgi:hypothetical protein
MATSFSDGRSRSTRREPPTMGKQLVNFITYGCESSAPFFVIYKARDEEISLLYWLICAYTFFLRNLLKRSFTWTVYCYLQTRCPLWYMVRLSSPTCDLGTCWAVLWVWTLGNFTCSQQIFNLLPVTPNGMWGSNKGTPLLPVLGHLLLTFPWVV